MNEVPNPFGDSTKENNASNQKVAQDILPQPEHKSVYHHRIRKRSLFWPIALIGFGILLLLSNMGYFPTTGWAVLWRFWPIALIALGLDVAIGRRSTGGAIAGAVLILILVGLAIGAALFAEQIPFLIELSKPAVLQFEHVEHPLNDIEKARVTLDWTSAPGRLQALVDSGNLIEADVAYRGELQFDVTQEDTSASVILDSYLQGVSYGVFTFDDAEAEWDVGLNPAVEYELVLDVGSGSCDFDLSEFNLDYIDIDGGSGSTTLTLPQDSFSGEIDAGSGSFTIIVPDDAGLQLEIERGSGGLHLDDSYAVVSGDIDDDAVWESMNYAHAEYQIQLYIDQGSGTLLIR